MTVEELRQTLEIYPGEMPVIISADEEGNSFEPLWLVEECFTEELDFWRSKPPTSDKVLVLFP